MGRRSGSLQTRGPSKGEGLLWLVLRRARAVHYDPGTAASRFSGKCGQGWRGVSGEAGGEKVMRCDLCKKHKASVHITQNPMPGDMVCINLCSRCARKHRVDDP